MLQPVRTRPNSMKVLKGLKICTQEYLWRAILREFFLMVTIWLWGRDGMSGITRPVTYPGRHYQRFSRNRGLFNPASRARGLGLQVAASPLNTLCATNGCASQSSKSPTTVQFLPEAGISFRVLVENLHKPPSSYNGDPIICNSLLHL